MTQRSYDTVIIGGGIIGVATALYLARAGQSVCVLERGAVGGESSGRAAGNIGQSHRPAPDLPIMRRAVELWKELYAAADIDFEFRQQGNLRLMMNEEHAARLTAMAQREQATGLDVRILDRADVRALAPYVREVYLGAVHCPSDGSADPFRSTLALARLATQAGAVIREECAVTGIRLSGGRVQGVETAGGFIAARSVLNAANSWAAEVGRMAGVTIPVEPKRSHLLVTERLPQFLGPVLSTDLYGYMRQAVSGNVLIGFPARPQQDFNRRVTGEAVATAAKRAGWIVPSLAQASMIRGFTGFTAWTADELPYIGACAQPEGFYVAAVFCGLGFSIAPAIGELMAELITTGRTRYDLSAYRVDRFASGGAHAD